MLLGDFKRDKDDDRNDPPLSRKVPISEELSIEMGEIMIISCINSMIDVYKKFLNDRNAGRYIDSNRRTSLEINFGQSIFYTCKDDSGDVITKRMSSLFFPSTRLLIYTDPEDSLSIKQINIQGCQINYMSTQSTPASNLIEALSELLQVIEDIYETSIQNLTLNIIKMI